MPLTTAPATGEQREFRATIISQAVSPSTFQSLDKQAAEAIAAVPVAGKNREPRVTVEREGDRVVSIRIQCACGKLMDLTCVYEDVPKPS
ncbi:MAG TPA: hypothetical protein VMA35_14895 [Candidatus Sulfopaludibacter sp.]|nr:hypothetical protein [Candidatus Sulfopaludibacter sp.]